MKADLAIITPYIGKRSETFIRRHFHDLSPGKTIALWRHITPPDEIGWNLSIPQYQFEEKVSSFDWLPHIVRKIVPARWKHSLSVKSLGKFCNEYHPEIFLGEYLDQAWPFIDFVKKRGGRFYAHAHGYDLSSMYRIPQWREKYKDYRKADGVIVVNSLMKNRLLSLGLSENKIHIVPYGVEVSDEPTAHESSTDFRCLAVGRMVEKKAPLMLLRAFNEARKKVPVLRLDYIGAGPLLPSAREYVNLHGLESVVAFHGGRDHDFVMKMMKRADVFVQHSIVDPLSGDEEGLPVAILEAMAAALPVVSTNHAGIPDAVIDGITGLLVNEGDAMCMAERIATLYSDEILRKKMGTAAWLRAKDNFTREKEVTALREILGLT